MNYKGYRAGAIMYEPKEKGTGNEIFENVHLQGEKKPVCAFFHICYKGAVIYSRK